MKICKVALNISLEGISALAVTEGACSWEELVLLEALWEKFIYRHSLHCTGDSGVVH